MHLKTDKVGLKKTTVKKKVVCIFFQSTHQVEMKNIVTKTFMATPGPHLLRIHLVRYSTSARYEKYSIIHLVRPIIHLEFCTKH